MHLLHDTERNHLYHHCHDCEWIAMDPAGFPDPEAERIEYLAHDNHIQNAGYVRMFQRLLSLIDQHHASSSVQGGTPPPEHKRALEFGCGHGPVLAELLRQRGWQVDLFDKYFYPDPVYLNRKYALITATEVIEHIPDPLAAMQLWSDHLDVDGCLALTTLLHPGPENFLQWWYRKESSHISFFTIRTFTELARQTGLQILASNQRDAILFVPED